jgi:antitoxin PrlF
MPSATVTSKNQITIPAEIRKRLGIRPGSRVEFVPGSDGVVKFKTKKGSFRELAGILHVPGMKPMTPRSIDRSIMRYMADQDKRIRAQYK